MIHLGRDMTKRPPVSLFDMEDVLMVYSPALISTKAGWCDFSISENIRPFCRLLQKRFLCNHDNLFKSKKEMRREQDGELTRKMKNSNGERELAGMIKNHFMLGVMKVRDLSAFIHHLSSSYILLSALSC